MLQLLDEKETVAVSKFELLDEESLVLSCIAIYDLQRNTANDPQALEPNPDMWPLDTGHRWELRTDKRRYMKG